jgi:hypothetical protein
MPTDPEPPTKTCDECGSPFFAAASEMDGLCPECAYYLYGYPNCDHDRVNGRCTKCAWDGSRSEYIRWLIRKADESSG